MANSSDAKSPDRGLSIGALVVIFLVSATPLLIAPIVPTIDYYSHVARYHVLAHPDYNSIISENFAVRWGILPNIGLDVLGTAISKVIPALYVAKIIVLVIFATQFFGAIYFNKAVTGRTNIITALAAAILLYSFIFTWGFANFLLGLGLVFWAAGWWLRHRERPKVALPVALLAAVAIFLTHGVAFALYGLLLGGIEIGLFLASSDRSIRSLARSMALLAVQAVVPAVLFLLSPTAKASDGVSNAGAAATRLARDGRLFDRLAELAGYRLTTIARVAEGPSFWFDAVTNLACAGIIAALLASGKIRVARPAWPALAIGVALVLVVPPAMFGVGYVSDRMPLFLAFLFVGALWAPNGLNLRAPLALGLAGIAAVKLVAVAATWIPYREDFASFTEVSRAISRPSVVGFVDLENDKRTDPGARCEMYGPLLVPLGHASPIFAIGTAQPLEIIGRLQFANSSRPDVQLEPGVGRALQRLKVMARDNRFDYTLVCGADRLPAGLPNTTTVARHGRFILLRHADAKSTRIAGH